MKFHIGQIYRLLEENAFIKNMQDFYQHKTAVDKAKESRVWFVQFLLVLALGTAFLSQPKNKTRPPGAKFFERAMSLMPDHGYLWRDGLMAIDVLALAGLYLYCIDHRESAHVYVSDPQHYVETIEEKKNRLTHRYLDLSSYSNSSARGTTH